MSFNFSIAAVDVADAKTQLAEKIADETNHIPTCVGEIVAASIDALPASAEYPALSLSAYGHFQPGDYPGTSNLTVSIQQVASDVQRAA